ncbi:release factor [Dentipellis sp. KUC8613]|nr:release factor [Dentipellis sp. KUC8613]
MLSFLRPWLHAQSRLAPTRHAAAQCRRASNLKKPAQWEELKNFERLQQDQARLLRVVQKKAELAKAGADEPDPTGKTHGTKVKNGKPLLEAWARWQHMKEVLNTTLPLLEDPEMRDLAKDESAGIISELTHQLTHVFPSLLTPPSETEELSALIELKSGVGGSESSLFLTDILRMYERFARNKRWHPTILASNESDNGGMKDAILEVKGEGAYDAFRWESGVHRVQRVPATESSGRVHTSTVAVVVLPLVEDPPSDGKEDLFDMEDVKIEVMRARGAGGQHVNKTESAVRLTHVPTGITVSMQDERSQHQNKRRAFQVLRARLLDQKLIRDQAVRRAARRDLVRTADRSEKIRTYNYPQDRVTDHRLGKGNMSWDDMFEGDGLQILVDELKEKNAMDALEDTMKDLESAES